METATGLAELTEWLQSYERAWEALDPDAAAALFTEDATYAWGPYEEPMRGRETIRARWTDVTSAQSDVQFGFETLGIVDSGGVARWWCSFNVGELKIELEGIFLLSLTDDGLCSEFREWFNERTSDAA
jgi:ketosteroid isomerase-like protein